MNVKEPMSAQRLMATDTTVTPWAEARRRLEGADFYWLATVRPDRRPHVRPVLAVWLEGSLYFCTGPATRKGKNLALNSYCAITAGSDDAHFVV